MRKIFHNNTSSILNVLTKSPEGFAILKAAQSGGDSGINLPGVMSLNDYLNNTQAEAA
jgi:hypothetical protein